MLTRTQVFELGALIHSGRDGQNVYEGASAGCDVRPRAERARRLVRGNQRTRGGEGGQAGSRSQVSACV